MKAIVELYRSKDVAGIEQNESCYRLLNST